MLDVNLARNCGQDLHKLRGLNRRLRYGEKLVASYITLDLMDAEFKPLDLANVLLGGGSPTRSSDSDD